MALYLVRHGKALAEEVDPNRPLSEEGRRDVSRMATFVQPLELPVSTIWHSGKLRAKETAEILSSALPGQAAPVLHDGLMPNAAVAPIREEIERAKESLMIVGHLPFLDKLVSELVVDDESAGVAVFDDGAIICLNRDEGEPWRILWSMTPELLS